MSTVRVSARNGQPMRRLLLLVPAVFAANDTLFDGIDIAGHLGSPLTAGCSMIFLDLGANLGVQTRKLFEAEKYTKGKRPPVFRLFANAFGLDRDVWRTACSVGFEPSPFLWPRLAELGKRYAALGFRATFLRAGVGASTHRSCFGHGRGETGRFEACERGDTPVVDLAAFLRTHVERRAKVVAKLDVEGMEYAILPRLLATRAHCLVESYGVEWHRPHEHGDVVARWERATRPRNASACATSREMDDETFREESSVLWP